MDTIQDMVNRIELSSQKHKTKLIAVDGLGGSGKSTFVKMVVAINPKIKVLELDHFPCLPEENPYHSAGAQTRVNLDRFKKEAIIPLTLGNQAIYENTFWWPTKEKPKKYEIAPGGVVIVEGCYSYHSELREFYDLSIWISCHKEKALKRAIARDGKQGIEIWQKAHAPNERNYALLQRPMDYVDLIVDNNDGDFRLV